MAASDFTAEQILAALEEAVRPDYVSCRYDRGVAWANLNARQIMNRTALDKTPEQNLATVEKALREWLADGPDYDCQDYVSGCEDGQRTIRDILDGDVGEVLDALESASSRTSRLYLAARA
ncbi:hypothetical protein [Streptomyces lydicus]|uniref:hypothetical protein n=1 Tax=Streptomyces lydicus TaxID=47763 RepID=UPI0037B6EF84